MTKRAKQLTKRERKAIAGGPRPANPKAETQHIHCIACGRHLDPSQFDVPISAKVLRCEHGGSFPSCVACEARSIELIAEHDRTDQPVRTASAWH